MMQDIDRGGFSLRLQLRWLLQRGEARRARHPARPRHPFRGAVRDPAQVDLAGFEAEFTDEPGVTRIVWLFSMVLG